MLRPLIYAAALCVLSAPAPAQTAHAIHHYVYFGTDRERISEPWFVRDTVFSGAQLRYRWSELEPERDHYDFSAITHDLNALRQQHKRLFIQLQDASFSATTSNAPVYLTTDTAFHGGIAFQYKDDGDPSAGPVGRVARRWDPAVRARFQKLLDTLGRAFDGQIEGINLPETSVELGPPSMPRPSGFTPLSYREGVIDNMRALRRAFPRSVAMQYANFMSGEWLPANDHGHLRAVYAVAREMHLGMGGPDLMPFRRGQLNHTYAMMRDFGDAAPLGVAVQWGNYEEINPNTNTRITTAELVAFARDVLHVTYIFWETQEPFFTKEVVPFLHAAH